MNPLTDKQSSLILHGKPVTIIQPGGKIARSTNWRLTEEAFRRYESHIRTALANWPAETKFDVPAGVSVNTFEHRLRDAMQALKLYGYDPDLQKQLANLRTELVVSMDADGKAVYIRERGKRGRPVTLISTRNERNPQVKPAVQPAPTEAILRAYLTLSAAGQRPDPIHFQGQIDAALCATLEAEFDTAFVFNPETNITVML